MYKFLSTIALGVFVSWASPAIANVKVTLNSTEFYFESNPRLSEVLEKLDMKVDWYWPASKLYKSNGKESIKVRADIIKKLASFNREHEYQSVVQSVIDQIENWSLADRVVLEIDYEHARYNLDFNPLFESGNYTLLIAKRPNKVDVFGAIEAPIDIEFLNNQCVSGIIGSLQKLDFADKNYVYIIQPDTKVIKAPIAYWNERCVVPMPGSSIYVPLKENQLFSNVEEINKSIARLAVNRIDQQ